MKYFRNMCLIFLILLISACCCKDTSKPNSDIKVEVAKPALPPGMAIVSAEVISLTEETCTIKVLSIEERGQGTDSITKGQEIIFKLNKILEENAVKPGEKINFKLRGSQAPAAMGGEEKSKWSIVSIIK